MISGGMPTVYVSDLERAVRFYVETLGFKLTARHGERGEAWAMIDAGDGLLIGLRPATPDRPKPGTPGSIAIGLHVSQAIEDVVAVLENRGVVFDGRAFGDPDGNALYLWSTR